MKKQYEIPTCAVVEISKKDVVATSSLTNVYSNVEFYYGGGWNGYARAGERGFDE